MNKILLLLVLIFSTASISFAEKKVNNTTNSEKSEISDQQLLASIKACTELNKELVKEFGENYSLSNQNVINKLQQNSLLQNRVSCVCKISTYVINTINSRKK